eukprot:symbB.v1.2.037540.t1/scaffold5571.1/size28630/3
MTGCYSGDASIFPSGSLAQGAHDEFRPKEVERSQAAGPAPAWVWQRIVFPEEHGRCASDRSFLKRQILLRSYGIFLSTAAAVRCCTLSLLAQGEMSMQSSTSTARNMPAPISDHKHLARAQLERFDLTSALSEYRSILIMNHQRNLAGGLIEPPRAEVLRKSPMAASQLASFGAAMLQLESGMTQDEINKCSLAASNAWADECMAKAIQPSKANVQAVTIRGAGPADKITVKTDPSDVQIVASNRPEFEKVWNTYGSSAGSGSCSIPIYYKHRRIELAS